MPWHAKKERLRSEVRVDEVHLDEIAYCMNVSWICWNCFRKV